MAFSMEQWYCGQDGVQCTIVVHHQGACVCGTCRLIPACEALRMMAPAALRRLPHALTQHLGRVTPRIASLLAWLAGIFNLYFLGL